MQKKSVSNGEVAEVTTINISTISSCNRFFADIKLIEPVGRGNVPADAVFEFQRQWEWDRDTAAHALATVVRGAWFWELLNNRLSFKALSDDEAIKALASESQAAPVFRQQLEMIIELLIVVGLVARDTAGC